MESPVKTPNISEMMSRFARSCKLRSMEFLAELNDFPDGYPNAQNLPYQEIPTENGSENQKIVEDNPVLLFDGDSNSARAADDNSLEVMISNLFANISAFKAAYVQLQTAHTPFDVNNIQTADRAVIAQLQKLSDLKKCYRNGYKTLLPDTQLEAQVHERQCMLRTYEMMLNRLESDIQSKDTEVDLIKEEIKKVNAINFKLEKKLREESDLCLSIELFVRTVQEASRECHGFSKLLIGLMKDAKWDLDSAAHSIQPDIRYAKRVHKKFAFESYVCNNMFGGFENEDFYILGGLSSVLDPEKYRLECFSEFQDLKEQDPLKFLESYSPKGDCMFEKFCHKKYMQVVHPKMEKSFFGDLGQRDCVENGGHPDSAFYQTFLKLAKSVWLVHRLAFSFDPTVNIFQVRRGTLFSAVYMESVVQGVVFGIEGVDDRRPKVGFTVMPGFRVGKTVIQCQVYLIDTECID
ncbi:hypothetical protein SUGI_0203270 [Cryptomeria japonica]|nr:hypothetical protein SUGI_0203270 [Cryptomeria japonica]